MSRMKTPVFIVHFRETIRIRNSSGCDGNSGKEVLLKVQRQDRANKVGGHADENPTHQTSHPIHPLAGFGQCCQLPRKQCQYKQGGAQPQAQGEKNDKSNQWVTQCGNPGQKPQQNRKKGFTG